MDAHMSAADYIQTIIIPVVALLVVYYDARRRPSSSLENKMLHILTISIITVLISDGTAWAFYGSEAPYANFVLWVTNTVYFVITALTAAEWLVYTIIKLRGENGTVRFNEMLVVCIPLVAYLIMLFMSTQYGFFFSIDDSNIYHRGPLIWLQQVLCWIYMAVASFIALKTARKAPTNEKQREAVYLASFTVLPLIGGIIQIYINGTSFLWLFSAASFIMLYVNLQQGQVSLDPMTRLHNRRKLSETLEYRCGMSASDKGSLYIIHIDIDDFKRVNDLYGHQEGDIVICRVASLLKECFLHTNAFLARQGGDEFAVIINSTDDNFIKERIETLKANAAESRCLRGGLWQMSLSVGCVRYDYDRKISPDELMRLADEKMYEVKAARKAAVIAESRT